MYTDSEACLKIATNSAKLGKVRHLEIRYHLVRCLILSGNIVLAYCITEEMLADLFTKGLYGPYLRELSSKLGLVQDSVKQGENEIGYTLQNQ